MPPDRRDHSEPLFEVKPPADPALESLVLGAIIRDGAPPGIGTINSRAEDLDEAIRVAMYITDLTLARMGGQIVHDFEDQP